MGARPVLLGRAWHLRGLAQDVLCVFGGAVPTGQGHRTRMLWSRLLQDLRRWNELAGRRVRSWHGKPGSGPLLSWMLRKECPEPFQCFSTQRRDVEHWMVLRPVAALAFYISMEQSRWPLS